MNFRKLTVLFILFIVFGPVCFGQVGTTTHTLNGDVNISGQLNASGSVYTDGRLNASGIDLTYTGFIEKRRTVTLAQSGTTTLDSQFGAITTETGKLEVVDNIGGFADYALATTSVPVKVLSQGSFGISQSQAGGFNVYNAGTGNNTIQNNSGSEATFYIRYIGQN